MTPTAARSSPRSARRLPSTLLPLLARYLRPQWRRAALMAALLLAAIALQLWVPLILRDFIDAARAGASGAELRRTAGWFFVVALASGGLAAVATVLSAEVGWRATNGLREDLARHCLDLDMHFHAAHAGGELIERIDGDVTALSNFFSQFAVRVAGGLLLLVGALAVLWFEHPLVGACFTALTLLELAVLARTRALAVPATTLEREASARLFGFIEERVAGLDDLRANGGGFHALQRFREPMRVFFRDTRRAWQLRSVVWMASYGLFVLGTAVMLGAVIHLLRRGAITLGTGYMVFQYLLMLQLPIEQITQQLQDFQKAAAGGGRIEALFARRSRERPRPPGAAGARLAPGPLALRFQGVDFRYPTDPDFDPDSDPDLPPESDPAPAAQRGAPALQGITFELAPGRVLGLLGRTGSGKTTLTRLLFRFHEPSGGRLELNGVDVRDLDLDALRAAVGLVTQEVQLFAASVRDNLTFFDASVPDARCEAVLRELGLGEWLAALPHGLDTPLEAGGGNLSAGEAQLLAFARVFLKDPGLVVLDEFSSRLDPASEQRLERALVRLLRGRTAVIVAHRLRTVARADEILVMGDGRMLEHGPREALARDPRSHYARLLAAGRDLDAPTAESGVGSGVESDVESGAESGAESGVGPGVAHGVGSGGGRAPVPAAPEEPA